MEFKNINIRNLYIDLLNKIKNVEGVDKDYVDGLIEVIDYHLTALDTDLAAIESVIPESASVSNPLATEDDIPAAQVNSDWNAISGVAEILNKPTIPAAQVNSDWNAISGVAEILNKPTIPVVPTVINPIYAEFTVDSWTLVFDTYRAGFQIQGVLNYTLPHLLFIRPLSAATETAAEKAAFALITRSELYGDATPPVNSYLELFADTEPTTSFKIGVIAWKTE